MIKNPIIILILFIAAALLFTLSLNLLLSARPLKAHSALIGQLSHA